MGKLTLILGGARSGKSTYAERLAARHPGPVTYIATAQALDPEMTQRIAAHRQARPAGWQTRELPHDVGQALQGGPPPQGIVLLDCLTLLISNLVLRACPDLDNPDEAAAVQAVTGELERLEQ
ncbi:MAG: bifunctional adenosylcobinamide kinase/adenosylcobinamide-phosphate guanylyltransferase, partial [Chloroflexota bacterium]